MFNPASFATERPRVVALATVLAVAFGVLTYLDLPRSENPVVPESFAAVHTYLPGAEPDKVELLVSKVLEDHIAEVDDLDMILSRSTNGYSFLLIAIESDAPLRERMQELQDKVRQAQLQLPVGASEPEVDTRTLRTYTMVLALLQGDVLSAALRHQAKELKRGLELLPDVMVVEMLGEPEEEIAVDVDLRRLSQNGIPIASLISSIDERNVLTPGGELEAESTRYPIRTTGAFDVPAEVGTTLLGASIDGLPIELRDVATIERRVADPEVRMRWRGDPAVSIAVEMRPGHNAIAFGEKVKAFVAEWQQRLPAGMRIEVVADEPYYVERRLDSLFGNLLLGMVLVVALTLVGMGWRSGLVVSLTVPLSFAMAMGLLGIGGVELHQLTIAGMVIAVGLIVDEAIVVTDNIQRHVDLGASPVGAAVEGLGEIHHAVLAGAATTIAAFVPIAMMVGDIGEFTRAIPLTVSILIVASVTVAHFVTPLLAVALHSVGRTDSRAEQGTSRIATVYRSTLRRVMAHPRTVLLLFCVSIVVSLTAMGRYLLPPAFFPFAERTQFLLTVGMPPAARFEETDRVMTEIEEILAERKDIASWAAYIGAGIPKIFLNAFTEGKSPTFGMFLVDVQPDLMLETPQIALDVERVLKESISGPMIRATRLVLGYGDEVDINIYVSGDRLDVLRTLAKEIREIVESVPGTHEARESFGFDPVSLQANIDPVRSNLLGVSHEDVSITMRTAMDGVTATTFREDDEEIDVVVRADDGQRRSVADLLTLPLFSPKAARAVPLSSVAAIEPTFTNQLILRWNRKREVNIQADVVGRSLFAVAGEVEEAVRRSIKLPDDYEIAFEGERQEVTESFLSLARAALVAIFLIYIILVVRFRSMLQPVLIVLAIPMALVGSVWGLITTSSALGFMSFLGMISLTGIVVNDSIIMLDYINTLRRRGIDLETAVFDGAATRLRPIALTTLTTIGGLLPLSISGGDYFGPFGWAMIFGLLASMVLTLLVQPAAYLAVERRRNRQF